MSDSIITIRETPERTLLAFFGEELTENGLVGEASNPEEAIQNLFLNAKMFLAKEEDEKLEVYIKTKMPKARALALEFFAKVGPEPFTVGKLQHEFSYSKEDAEVRLDYLSEFGFIKKSAEGKKGAKKEVKWILVVSGEDLIKYYTSQHDKFDSTAQYYKGLADQILELEKAEKEDEAKTMEVVK